MRCDQFESDLNQALDQRENPVEIKSLRSHASQCADCQHLLDGQMAVVKQLSGKRHLPPPPVDLADRVLESFHHVVETQPKKNAVLDRLLWIGVAAAAVLLAVSLIRFDDDPNNVAGKNKKSPDSSASKSAVANKDDHQPDHVAGLDENGRSSVSEALIVPPALYIWSQRQKYNEWINGMMDSMRKMNESAPKKPRADLPRQLRFYV